MISKEKQDLLDYFNLGLSAYKLRKWDDAIKAFQMALKIDGNDGPSVLYLKRVQEYKKNPPADDWDGVFTMTTK